MHGPITDFESDAFRATPAYQAAHDFLMGRINYERTPKMPYTQPDLNLSRMRRLLELLGNPHERIGVIHVAGTKGKGSTATLLSAALSANGLRCGTYTSPHLHFLEERFVLDEIACTPATLVQLVNRVRPVVLRMDEETQGHGPTYFEITTAIAFDYFFREAVDLAVIEVGLGGRLDSTNVCQPLVSVITSISYDHTRQLGHTLTSIATEKAGIIKPGIPVVSGATTPDAKETIAAIAARNRSALHQLDVDFRCTYEPPPHAELDTTGTFDFEVCDHGIWRPAFESIRLGLLGRHQAANAAVAIAALQELPATMAISENSIREGFQAARCPARVEVVANRPLTIVDAAHNVASIRALVGILKECFPHRRRTLLLATTKGKDVEGMLKVLLPAFDRVHCSKYLNNPRAFDPQELCALARRISHDQQLTCAARIEWSEDPATAWKEVSTLARPTDLICITGSFFIATETRELLCWPLAQK